ncbi:MAG: VWA domain-containing protein [Spirochaetota bacterium]
MKKALILILFVLCAASEALGGPFIRIHSVDTDSDFPRVSLLVSARDTDGNWISGLDEDNILIYEDGFRVNYVQVAGQSRSTDTLYLVFSIDSSKSLSENTFKKLKKSAVDIVTASSMSERIALVRFNDRVVIVKNFSDNKHALVSTISEMSRHGTKTMLYNAIYDSVDLVSRADSGRKAIVIFTDGKDEGSSVTMDDVVDLSRESGVPLYVITMSGSRHIESMNRMAKLTGGQTVLIDTVDSLVLAYKRVIQNIKSQHLVKYVSMATADGRPHRLEVRLKYESIRDRDIREFMVEKEFFTIEFPDYTQILLIIMLILFVVLLGIGLVFLVRRRSHIPYERKDKKRKEKNRKKYGTSEEPDFDDEFFTASTDRMYSADTAAGQPEKRDYEMYANAWLILQSGGRRKKFPLSKDEVVIGTSQESHLVVKNSDVSPRHCSIKYMDGSYYLFDLVSLQGTFLNGKKLLRPRQLFDWDEITIGPVSFIFRGSTV